jgi:hypothetical protein
MSPESSDPTQLEDARWPGDDGWPDDAAEEPDPGWPDDDEADEPDPDWPDDWPEDDARDGGAGTGLPWPAAPAPPGWGGRPERRGPRPLTLAVVAVVALLVGGVALAVTRELDRSAAPGAAPTSQPSFSSPGGNSGSGTVPGGSGNGAVPGGSGATGEAFIAGPVQKVSSTSITIGAGEESMTAAVTSATKVTGKVTSIGAIKVGDDVSAQVAVNGGRAAVSAIQDPAQAPSSGGGLP